MAHDVFISHSALDKAAAEAVCAALENNAIRCWMAPRDISGGEDYTGAIVRAIKASRVLVLIFSTNTNAKPDMIRRELELAAKKRIPIIPVRVEDAELADDELEFFLSSPQWVNAFPGPSDEHLDAIVKCAQRFLAKTKDSSAKKQVAELVPAQVPSGDGASAAADKRPHLNVNMLLQAGKAALPLVVPLLVPGIGTFTLHHAVMQRLKHTLGEASLPLVADDFSTVLGVSKSSTIQEAIGALGPYDETRRNKDGSIWYVWCSEKGRWLVFHPGLWLKVHFENAPALVEGTPLGLLARLPPEQRPSALSGFAAEDGGMLRSGAIGIHFDDDAVFIAWV